MPKKQNITETNEQATEVVTEETDSFDFLEDGEDELKDDVDIWRR